MAERRSTRIEANAKREEEEASKEQLAAEKVDGRRAIRAKNVHWSAFEKHNILKGLRLHGTRDVDALKEFCPFRSKEGIECFIEKEKQNMTKLYKEVPLQDFPGLTDIVVENRTLDAPIEKWIKMAEEKNKKFRAECGHAMPKLLNVVSEHERHPDPEECGGIDYAAIYKALALLMQGEVPPEMNAATSHRLLDLLVMLQLKVREARDETEAQRDKLSKHNPLANPSAAPPKQRLLEDKYGNCDDLPGVNPLEIPRSVYDVRIAR